MKKSKIDKVKRINSNAKGKSGEREWANYLKTSGLDPTARRSQQYCGRAGDADVVGSLKIHWEVKRTNTININKFMEQAKHDSRNTKKIPVIASRRDKGEWLVTLRADDLRLLAFELNGQNVITIKPGDTAATELRPDLERFCESFFASEKHIPGYGDSNR